MIQISHRNQAPEVDLEPIQEQLDQHEEVLKAVCAELEMQRRALVAIKVQRDVDRSRRLMLIKRLGKERTASKKTVLTLKVAIAASLLLPLLMLINR